MFQRVYFLQVLFNSHSPFFQTGSLIGLILKNRLDWLVSEIQGSSFFISPVLGVKVCNTMVGYSHGAGNQTQVLTSNLQMGPSPKHLLVLFLYEFLEN